MLFGNNLRRAEKLQLGTTPRFLVNVGHMSETNPLEDEKEKVKIAHHNGIDIIADNSITSYAYSFRRWITDNFDMKLNTVPVYECFDKMSNGQFEDALLLDAVEKHILNKSDMIVVHPGITRELAYKVRSSNRNIKITSRGGAQLYAYIMKTGNENPYLCKWNDLLALCKDTGVALAIGLSLRAGSILDELDSLYLEEMDICAPLVKQALDQNIPVIVEGIGHVRLNMIKQLISEIKTRCYNVPVKTLGPISSDRTCGVDDISSLISSAIAAYEGADILGVLLKSEHLGQPLPDDYSSALRNASVLKYLFKTTVDVCTEERQINVAKNSFKWCDIFDLALFPEAAKSIYFSHNTIIGNQCTMCGERCALKLSKETNYET